MALKIDRLKRVKRFQMLTLQSQTQQVRAVFNSGQIKGTNRTRTRAWSPDFGFNFDPILSAKAMLETKYVDDNFAIFVTNTVLVTNISELTTKSSH